MKIVDQSSSTIGLTKALRSPSDGDAARHSIAIWSAGWVA